jgi:hypothetical protein
LEAPAGDSYSSTSSSVLDFSGVEGGNSTKDRLDLRLTRFLGGILETNKNMEDTDVCSSNNYHRALYILLLCTGLNNDCNIVIYERANLGSLAESSS